MLGQCRDKKLDEKIFRDTKVQIGILKSRGIIIRNRKLRLITLEYILEIEKQAKSIIAYCFSKEHGHKSYLDPENFEIRGTDKYRQVCDLLSGLYKKISLNIDKDWSITHYVGDKNYIPLWVLVNTISMGDTSKFYANMLQRDREEVARRMKWGIRENQLTSCLYFLSSIRNRCAHDERLYNYLSYAYLCDNKYSKYFHVGKSANNYFSVMIAFKLLLSRDRYMRYHNQIENLFDELETQLKTISVKKIRNLMGMPNNWRRLKTLN